MLARGMVSGCNKASDDEVREVANSKAAVTTLFLSCNINSATVRVSRD